jgi:hypothetical protein
MQLARLTVHGLVRIAVLVSLLGAMIIAENLIMRGAQKARNEAIRELEIMRTRTLPRPLTVPTNHWRENTSHIRLQLGLHLALYVRLMQSETD